MADVIGLYRRAVDGFAQRLRTVTPDQWSLPTPDAGWDVRALVGHVVSENQWLPPLLEGRTIAEVGDRFEGDQLGEDPLAAWEAAATAASAACDPDDVLDRVVHVSFGDISGGDYLAQITADHVIHTWDLARAVGGDERLDPELVDFTADYLGPQVEGWRSAGAFGPAVAVPDDADAQVRLLALTGRDPLGTAAQPAGFDDPASDADDEAAREAARKAVAAEERSKKLQSDLATLAAQARSIQAELDSYTTTRDHYWRTKAEDWTADLARYDRVLVTMALLLGHPVPPEPPHGAQRRLSREERAGLQELLESQGLDLGRQKTTS